MVIQENTELCQTDYSSTVKWKPLSTGCESNMAAVYKTYWVDMPYCVFVWDVFLTTDGYFFRQLTVKAPLRPSGNIKEDHVVFENKFNNEHRDNFPMSAVFPTLFFLSSR